MTAQEPLRLPTDLSYLFFSNDMNPDIRKLLGEHDWRYEIDYALFIDHLIQEFAAVEIQVLAQLSEAEQTRVQERLVKGLREKAQLLSDEELALRDSDYYCYLEMKLTTLLDEVLPFRLQPDFLREVSRLAGYKRRYKKRLDRILADILGYLASVDSTQLSPPERARAIEHLAEVLRSAGAAAADSLDPEIVQRQERSALPHLSRHRYDQELLAEVAVCAASLAKASLRTPHDNDLYYPPN